MTTSINLKAYETQCYSLIIYDDNTAEVNKRNSLSGPYIIPRIIPDAKTPLNLENLRVRLRTSGNIEVTVGQTGTHILTNDFLASL